MPTTINIKTSSGKAVIDRAAGGTFKVNDIVLIDDFENQEPTYRRAKILKLYCRQLKTGLREFADVLYDNGQIRKDLMTMFFEPYPVK